jgi:hypothetical protein
VPTDDLAAAVARRAEVTAVVHAAGYRYVTLDLDGLRSGNLNAALGTSASTLVNTAPVGAATSDMVTGSSELAR